MSTDTLAQLYNFFLSQIYLFSRITINNILNNIILMLKIEAVEIKTCAVFEME
jgi:hypothetical protein